VALVTRLEKEERSVATLHRTHLVARYMVAEVEGGRLFQINSYGSDDRQIPGKLSQTLQFTEDSAHQLYRALKAEFGFSD
jgi:hypothetical protein